MTTLEVIVLAQVFIAVFFMALIFFDDNGDKK